MKGILMTASNGQKIFDGSKTQTMRPLNDEHLEMLDNGDIEIYPPSPLYYWYDEERGEDVYYPRELCPHGKEGDTIYIKEPFWAWGFWDLKISSKKSRWEFIYLGDYSFKKPLDVFKNSQRITGWYKRPSIFLPECFARSKVRVKKVDICRVQDITETEAQAEGVSSIAEFAVLWDSINGKKKGKAWNDNPWVWKIKFERVL
jgi:hypothetical protein